MRCAGACNVLPLNWMVEAAPQLHGYVNSCQYTVSNLLLRGIGTFKSVWPTHALHGMTQGTEISVFWTNCMCPSLWKWSWTLSAVLHFVVTAVGPHSPLEVKLNFVCSEVLKWLQLDPPRSEVELCLQWSSEVTAVGHPPRSEVELCLQWSSEVCRQSSTSLLGGSNCSHFRTSLQTKFNFTSGGVSNCSHFRTSLQTKFNFTSGGPTAVTSELHCRQSSTSLLGGSNCSHFRTSLQTKFNFTSGGGPTAVTSELHTAVGSSPGTLHDCNFRILNI